MDAYGNLTTDDEFLTGRRIRLISYLDPDVAMGVTGDTDTGWSGVGVHRLSNGSPNETIFIAGVAAGSKSRMFYLAWGSDPNQALSMEGDSTGRLTLEPISQSIDGDPTYYPEFQAQWQNGPWFVLSAFGSSQVVDISESGTGENNPIIAFQANGGGNQTWRAQDVDFVPPAGGALANADTPAASAAPDPVKSGKPG
ncbi:hypothetical protein [Brevundimonas sp.]|uniref:RICIN domain-containing protein n=1 Tax=Brevundimonas sp. TaxID=1871086 RepID=UPI0025B7EF49|nr:hypothetical protein [Brevundimonas sp.]